MMNFKLNKEVNIARIVMVNLAPDVSDQEIINALSAPRVLICLSSIRSLNLVDVRRKLQGVKLLTIFMCQTR